MIDLSKDESLILVSEFEVTSAETDMYGRLRLGGMTNFLIQSAIRSADSLGFGFGGLSSQQLFWVLSRLTVETVRPLQWYEKVLVTTWPKTIDGLLYIRDFEVCDSRGNPVAKATSGWLAVDMHTHRPRHVEDKMDPILNRLKTKHAIEHLPDKLTSVSAGQSFEVQATYFDLDLNKHVTSTRYIDWMMDTFDSEFHKINYPKKLSINYMRETMLNENLNILRSLTGDGEFRFDGLNSVKSGSNFRGKIAF